MIFILQIARLWRGGGRAGLDRRLLACGALLLGFRLAVAGHAVDQRIDPETLLALICRGGLLTLLLGLCLRLALRLLLLGWRRFLSGRAQAGQSFGRWGARCRRAWRDKCFLLLRVDIHLFVARLKRRNLGTVSRGWKIIGVGRVVVIAVVREIGRASCRERV